ncbi:GNAT family N-acetyltransferase [Uliginosibacterium sp. H1]|uniref:GNAT family N-acetyltransferase n=1 Tax=Uliginosibacterium sp. H1 TaxID=3114757 RepID=UPI002E179DC6|nr:GNAT family N-acetyltransferase [Uliginosibacterium sp. H1]
MSETSSSTSSDTSPPEVHDNPARSRFELQVDGLVAVARYELSADGSVITFTHTVVPEALRGRGLAGSVVNAGLAAARQRALKVVPQCAVFAAFMRKHPETQDLLAPDFRFTEPGADGQ